MHRSDRKLHLTNQTTGGGVLLACKNELRSERIELPFFSVSFPTIDVLCCKCQFKFTFVYIFVVYIPPNTSAEHYELFFEAFEQLYFCVDAQLLVFGDFNIPHYINKDTNDIKTNIITNFSTYFGLQQHNGILNGSGRLLDLVFTNLKCEILHDNAPLVKEDIFHPALLIKTNIPLKCKNFVSSNNQKTYNFKKANFPALYTF